MGGEKEFEVEKTKKEVKVSKKSEKTDVGAFRIHLSGGEVHVHDDANKLKAAVPVSAWWKMWDRLRNEPGIWTWIDPHFKTKLTVETVVDQGTVDAKMAVTPMAFGDSWDKINTFSKK